MVRESTQRRWRFALVGIVTLVLIAAGGCASQRTDPGGTAPGGKAADNFVFAASSDPIMMDPAFASDGESFRLARQIFEGLVSLKPGTTELEPLLATEWNSSADGKEHSFTLREGVKFHDGTDFNAAAVCANFERWYNFTGLNQAENLSYYYGKIFRGFKTGEKKDKALYQSCTAEGNKATIKLTAPFASLVQVMTLPAFAMQSPEALKKYNADATSGTEKDPRFSEYATSKPTGTGPFTFESWKRGEQITLKRNDSYWGEKAKVATAIVRVISDPKARTQELENGNIDGYDLVAPADTGPLKSKGFQILNRPAFNILYLAMNQYNKALQDIRVRQAISYAINKPALISQVLPEGTKPATQFMPDMVNGYNPNVKVYEHNIEQAKKLLAEAGQSNLELKFAYPTGVSRPYMPTPEDTYVALKAQLEAVGIKVTPVPAKWTPDYLQMVQTEQGQSKHDIYLLGWTGDYNDPDNFVGVFFGQKSFEWGFDNPALFQALQDGRSAPNQEQQKAAYEKINAQIADFIPGVPLAHPAPSLGFGAGVKGYQPSPVQDEVWNSVSVTR